MMMMFVFEIGFEGQIDFNVVRVPSARSHKRIDFNVVRVPSARSHKSRKISDLTMSDLLNLLLNLLFVCGVTLPRSWSDKISDLIVVGNLPTFTNPS